MFDPRYVWLIFIVCLIIFLVLWFTPNKKKEMVPDLPLETHISEPVATLVKRLQEGKATMTEKAWQSYADTAPMYYTSFPPLMVYEIKDKPVGLSIYIDKYRNQMPNMSHEEDFMLRGAWDKYLSARKVLVAKIEESQFWLSPDEKIHLKQVCDRIRYKEIQKKIETELAIAVKARQEQEEQLRKRTEGERNYLISQYRALDD